jgi:hypothetical protein
MDIASPFSFLSARRRFVESVDESVGANLSEDVKRARCGERAEVSVSRAFAGGVRARVLTQRIQDRRNDVLAPLGAKFEERFFFGSGRPNVVGDGISKSAPKPPVVTEMVRHFVEKARDHMSQRVRLVSVLAVETAEIIPHASMEPIPYRAQGPLQIFGRPRLHNRIKHVKRAAQHHIKRVRSISHVLTPHTLTQPRALGAHSLGHGAEIPSPASHAQARRRLRLASEAMH